MTRPQENTFHKIKTNAPGDKSGMVDVIVVPLPNGDFEVLEDTSQPATPKLTLF